MLVVLAIIGGTPTKRRAGDVIKLLPPATELRIPPKKPAQNRNSISNIVINYFKVMVIIGNKDLHLKRLDYLM